ncbi:glycosyltransferase [Oscillibacter valericigenes]|uniref:glycosyltransferase n=1 Tax=Oscillibacter valericigenes TaxID=351091 RepID=UPI001F313FF4|nr:glycosyltransferase [Oscillibacter valericigenes]MCF2617853.1 glycosyltransferase [Oscillibacter valericigenes]
MEQQREREQSTWQEPKRSRPLFSIGIVSYNQHEYIFQCIDSILRQNYPAIEVIIADDHSYDFDREEIERYIEKHRKNNLVRYEVFSNEENIGIVKNCNRCISRMRGDYFKTIAADDMLYSNDVFAKMVRYMEEHNSKIVCGRAKAITHDGKPTQDLYPTDYDFNMISGMTAAEQYNFMLLRPWCPIFAPCIFMRRDFFEKMGGYDEQYTYTEDWPFWIRVTKAGEAIDFVDMLIIRYRYGGISNSGDNEFTINHLRARHYQECADLLRAEVPNLKEHGTWRQVLRCQYSANAIEMRRELEFFWKDASFAHKLIFRMKKLPVLFYIKLMSAITYRSRFHIRKECTSALVVGVLMQLGVNLFPWDNTGRWMAAIILLAIALILMKLCANVILTLLSLRADLKTRLLGK